MKSLICLFVLVPGILLGQKAKSYETVTQALSMKSVQACNAPQPIRLAVVPFTASNGLPDDSKAFGNYLTETIIGSLSGYSSKIKLFERTRLDALLKEHEFILTDMMTPAAALKIGQLAPIDALLSGTFTKLKSYVDISARIIDVATGEITMSYSGRIKMTKNLQTLFEEKTDKNNSENISTGGAKPINIVINNTNGAGSVNKTKAEICKERVVEFRPKLNDLSTTERIESVVAEATSTPFDNYCGRLHYDVMYSFTRFKITNERYKKFILNTIDTIAYPAGDDRAYEIIQFLASDTYIDEAEWQSSFRAIARVGNYSLSTYLNYLLAKPDLEPGTAKKRIDQYFALARANKLGLPRPVSLEVAFFEMMEGVKNNQPLREYCYEMYAAQLSLDDKMKATLFTDLGSMYKEATTSEQKEKIIQWLIGFVNTNTYAKAAEQLYDFAWNFRINNYSQSKEKNTAYRQHDIQVLAEKCKERFAEYAVVTRYESQKEDRVNFCVTYGIPLPGIIPTMPEAKNILMGDNLDEQERVLRLLALMGERPSEIEDALVSLFSKKSVDNRTQLEEIQTLAIEILGNCKSANKNAIDFMISTLPHYGNDTEAAKEALVKIGKPTVAPLTARLAKTTDQEGGLQYQLITLLGKIGKEAAPATSTISGILSKTRNADVKYAAEAALQAIQ